MEDQSTTSSLHHSLAVGTVDTVQNGISKFSNPLLVLGVCCIFILAPEARLANNCLYRYRYRYRYKNKKKSRLEARLAKTTPVLHLLQLCMTSPSTKCKFLSTPIYLIRLTLTRTKVEKLINEVLSCDIKIIVPQELVRLQPTRVVAEPFFTLFNHVVQRSQHDLETEKRLDLWKQADGANTNRSIIINLSLRYAGHSSRNLGWCCLPMYPEDKDPGAIEWMEMISKMQDQISGKPRPSYDTWSSLRIEKIVKPFSDSKEFGPQIRKSFFCDTIWEFTQSYQLSDLALEIDTCHRDELLQNAQHICLKAYEWNTFNSLFNTLFSILSKNPDRLPMNLSRSMLWALLQRCPSGTRHLPKQSLLP